MNNKAMSQYKKLDTESNIENADAHRIIQMLLQGAIEKLNLAMHQMALGDLEQKGINISMAISIIDGLNASLDHSAGGELSENLEKLYDYMMRKLVEANSKNDTESVKEVLELLLTIKSGWDDIRDQAVTKQ